MMLEGIILIILSLSTNSGFASSDPSKEWIDKFQQNSVSFYEEFELSFLIENVSVFFLFVVKNEQHFVLQFIYSEKATKFCEIHTFVFMYCRQN